VWSLTCRSAGRLIEPGSPSPTERIEAARRCREFGVPVRFKFKPMIPVRNWREEYAALIERIFERTRPESLGFCVIMWMSFDDLGQRLDLDLLDPDLVEKARRAADQLHDVRTGPFPHEVRAEIYRFLIEQVRKHNQEIPIYISTESREMWDELGEELGQNPRSFICGCNPVEAPGPRMIPSGSISHSTYLSPSERE
jgi:spore photoproduct lyase